MGTKALDLGAVEELYDRGEYLAAWRSGEEAAPLVEWPGTQGHLLAGRIAYRLGAPRLGSALHLRARREDPSSLETLYYHASTLLFRNRVLEALEELEAPAGEGPPRIEAHLLGLRARVRAKFRDFDSAQDLLRRADEISPGDPWLLVERCGVLEAEDRYEQAAETAARTLELRPWYPTGVQVRGHLLVLLGKAGEAMDLFEEALGRVEDGGVAWMLTVLQREQGRHVEAWRTLDRYAELSPLMDRETSATFHSLRSDLAYLLDRLEDSALHARQAKVPFYARLADRLEGKPGPGRRVSCPVAFVRQHHRTCGPATLAALAGFFGKSTDHLAVTEAIWYGGTRGYHQRRWAEDNGFVVREFTVNAADARPLLDRGFPFAVVTEYPGGGHLQAIIGYDERRATFLIRDPYFPSVGEALIEGFLEQYRARGPRGTVIVPTERASELADLSLLDEAFYDRVYRIEAALEAHDRERAYAEYRSLLEEAPEHTLTIEARLSLSAYDRDSVGVLVCLERLLDRFPKDPVSLLRKIDCLRELGRRDERIALLEEFVGSAGAPLFLCRLAEELGADAREAPRTRRLLRQALRRDPLGEVPLHLLGKVEWSLGRRERARDLLRCAACLDPTDERHAALYFLASLSEGRTEEALVFLRRRFDRFGPKSPFPGRTLFSMLEQLRRHEEAFAVLERSLALRPEDGDLMLFAADALARSGRLAESRLWLEKARGRGREGERRRVAASLALQEARYEEAREHLEGALEAEPLEVTVHSQLVRLLAATRGWEEARAHLLRATDEWPFHAPLRRYAIETIGERDPSEALAQLARLLERDPADAWAHRERALRLADLGRFEEGLEAALRALELEPNAPPSPAIYGHLLRRVGRREEAVAHLRQAIRLDVDYALAPLELLRLEPRREERRSHLAFLREELERQRTVGPGILLFWRAAQQAMEPKEVLSALEAMRDRRPDLWQVWSALIGQLLSMDRGPDSRTIAHQATQGFALFPEAWLDLARTCCALGDQAEEERALDRALSLAPNATQPLHRLAALRRLRGDFEGARELLERGVATDPLDASNLADLARLLAETGRHWDALPVLERAVRLDPGHGIAWSLLASSARELLRPEEPEKLARALAKERPGEARSWLVLARVLQGLPERLGAVDRALGLDPRNLEALDLRATLLAEAGRFEEALQACDPPPSAERPAELEARRAWILARMGRLKEAVSAVRESLDSQPDNYWGWQLLADWCESLGDRSGSLRAAEEMVRIAPLEANSLGYLAHAAELQGDRERAKRCFRRALGIAPGYVFAAVNLFDLHLKDRELDAAADALARIPETGGGAQAHLRGVLLAATRGEAEEARARFRRLCRSPDADRATLERGIDTVGEVCTESGLRALVREMVDSDSANAGLGAVWMRDLLGRGSLADGDAEIDRLRPRDGVARSAAVEYVEVLVERGESANLRHFLRRRGEWLREDAAAWREVGEDLLNAGRWQLAREWLSDGRERTEDASWKLVALALLLRQEARLEEARAVSRRALERPEDEWTATHRLWLAADAAMKGNPEESLLQLARTPEQGWTPYYGFLRSVVKAAAETCASRERPTRARFRDAAAAIEGAARQLPTFRRDRILLRVWRRCVWKVANARGGIAARLWALSWRSWAPA